MRKNGTITRRGMIPGKFAFLSTDNAVEVLHFNMFEKSANLRKVTSTVSGFFMQVERGLVGILFMHDIGAGSLARFQKRVQQATRLVQAHVVVQFSKQDLELTLMPWHDRQHF